MSGNKFIAFLLACILMLTFISCTPVAPDMEKSSDVPPLSQTDPSDADVTARADYTNLGIASNQFVWNGLLFGRTTMLDLSSGDSYSLCTNPFCDESHIGCEIELMNNVHLFVLDPNYDENGPVLLASYFDRRLENGVIVETPYFLRYHFETREVEVLLKDFKLNSTPWAYDAKMQTIYYMIYKVKEDATSETTNETELVFCSLDVKSKKVREICVIEEQIIPGCIIGDTLYTDSQSSTLYSINLREKSPQLIPTGYRNGYLVDGYYYYYTTSSSTVQTPVPDDVIPLCEKYGAAPYAQHRPKSSNRVDLTKADAQPELIAENIVYAAVNRRYILVKELSPQYRYSYLNFSNACYPPNATNVPAASTLVHKFVDYDGSVEILRADTLESVAVIDLDSCYFSVVDMNTFEDGMIGYFSPETLENLLQSKTEGTSQTFAGYIPFNKPLLTDEDILPLNMN
ncbi:MAG: hypothetical protein IJW40_04865 [Clostridia bacterium]|nr:hypothetical protein [Clostridia bacterium]